MGARATRRRGGGGQGGRALLVAVRTPTYRFATLSLRSGWLRPLISLISFAISADMVREGSAERRTTGATSFGAAEPGMRLLAGNPIAGQRLADGTYVPGGAEGSSDRHTADKTRGAGLGKTREPGMQFNVGQRPGSDRNE